MSKPTLNGKLLYPTQFLASEEFSDKDVTLTIKAVRIENLRMVDGGTEDKPILEFKKTDKKLVLNKTNAVTIAGMYGNKAEKWVGKSITLFPTECQAFGKTVDCIRIRSSKPKSKPAPASSPGEDAKSEPVPVSAGEVEATDVPKPSPGLNEFSNCSMRNLKSPQKYECNLSL